MTVNALISAKHQDEPAKPEWRELLGGPFWNTHLAFFEPGDESAAPVFEVRERLYANGIVGDATVQYDTFAFRYALEKLEKLPAPKC